MLKWQTVIIGFTVILIFQCRSRQTDSGLSISEEDIKNTTAFLKYVAANNSTLPLKFKPTKIKLPKVSENERLPNFLTPGTTSNQVTTNHYDDHYNRQPTFQEMTPEQRRALIKGRWDATAALLIPLPSVSKAKYATYLKKFGDSTKFLSKTSIQMAVARLPQNERNALKIAMINNQASKIHLVRKQGSLTTVTSQIYPIKVLELIFDDDIIVDQFFDSRLINDDLKNLSKYLDKAGSFSKHIIYSGEDGVDTHVFKSDKTSQSLMLIMNRLARSIQGNPVRFELAFSKLNPKQRSILSTDTLGEDLLSRSQFIDLLARELLKGAHESMLPTGRSFSIDSHKLLMVIKTGVLEILKGKANPTNAGKNIAFSKTPRSNQSITIDAICVSHPRRSTSQTTVDVDFVEFKSEKLMSLRSFQTSKHFKSDLTFDTNYLFRCGAHDSMVVFDSLKKSISLPYPPKIRIPPSRHSINAVFLTNMASHTDEKAAKLYLRFLQSSMGLTMNGTPRKINNIVNELRTKLINSDVFVTVANDMDVANYRLYTKGTLTRFQKRIRLSNGQIRQVNIDLILPTKSHRINLSSQTAETIFLQRRQAKKVPMVILNQSSHSSKEIEFWMRAYRKSLERDKSIGIRNRKAISALTDVPFVVGSVRMFGADGFMDLLSQTAYSMNLISAIASGANATQVVKILNTPKFQSQLMARLKVEAKSQFGLGQINLGSGVGEVRNRSFSPISNIQMKHLFDLTTNIEIRSSQLSGRGAVIF